MEPVPFFLFLAVPPDDAESLLPPVRLNDNAMYFPERAMARPDMTICFFGGSATSELLELALFSVLDAWSADNITSSSSEEGNGIRSSIRLSSPPNETSLPSNCGGWVGANGFLFLVFSSFSPSFLSSFGTSLLSFLSSFETLFVNGVFNDILPGNTIKNRVGPPLFVAIALLPFSNDDDAMEGNTMDVDCTARLRKNTSDPLHDCWSKLPGFKWFAGGVMVVDFLVVGGLSSSAESTSMMLSLSVSCFASRGAG
mmetsp:Transcript_3619/g.8013  ORF Transcript_3619/g.8013 Transcript_3619/m.8013 type:complete len:255 (+) Transcript_3619:1439-2203(+)